MQVNQAGTPGNTALGMDPTTEGLGAAAGAGVERQVASGAAARAYGARCLGNELGYRGGALHAPKQSGGWISRLRYAMQTRVVQVQSQSLQRHAGLMGKAFIDTALKPGPAWLLGLGGLNSRLRATVSRLKEQVAPPPSVPASATAAASGPANATPLGDAAALAKVTAAVHQRFATQAGNKEAFTELLHQAFGDKFDAVKAETIRQQALAGDFSWAPKVQVVDARTLGDTSGTQASGTALGAYAQESDTIYLSRELLHSDPSKAERILTEEMGHAIDARLNTSDAVGDEGEIFAKLMHGDKISAQEMTELRADNDRGVINLNGRNVSVEYGWFKKVTKAISNAVKKTFNAVVDGVKKALKAAVNVAIGMVTLNFDRVRQGAQDFVSAGINTFKEVTKAAVDLAKDLHRIAKEQFKQLMQSKIFAAILMICRFIPIPIVQLVVKIVDMVRAAYMVYQGIKNKSISAVLGGIASLATGAGNVAGALGASASTVTAIKDFAQTASNLSMAYNAVANKDVGAALGLLGGMVGGPGASSTMATVATVANYGQQAVSIRESVRSGDTLGALGGALSVAGAAAGKDSSLGQQLATAQEVVTGARAVRELDRGNLDAAQSLASGMASAKAASDKADAIVAERRAAAAAETQAQSEPSQVDAAERDADTAVEEGDTAVEEDTSGSEAAEAEPTAEAEQSREDARVTIGRGMTLEGIAKTNYGENWRAGLAQMVLDNGLKLNQWGSPILREGRSLKVSDISDKSTDELARLSRQGGQLVTRNDKGLQAKAAQEEKVRQAAAQKLEQQQLAKAQAEANQAGDGVCTPSNPAGLSQAQKQAAAQMVANLPLGEVKPQTTVMQDLQIGLIHAEKTADSAISLLAGGLASIFSENERDKVFGELDARNAVRATQLADLEGQQGMGGKLISAIPQIPTMLFSGAETGMTMINNGERVETAINGTLIDTVGNAVSLVIPGSKGATLVAKAGSGAAINVAQDLVVRTALTDISETAASKTQFAPSWESTALAAVSGSVLGSVAKTEAKQARGDSGRVAVEPAVDRIPDVASEPVLIEKASPHLSIDVASSRSPVLSDAVPVDTAVRSPVETGAPVGSAGGSEKSYGVAFFGDSNLGYYTRESASIGREGKPFFFMPLEDAGVVKNAADAALYTGRAPSAEAAHLNGGEIYGLSFPTDGMAISKPTAADAGGWPHYLEGGNTAVRTGDGPGAGYLVNSTREFVTPGGKLVPDGSTLFQLGAHGEWMPIRKFSSAAAEGVAEQAGNSTSKQVSGGLQGSSVDVATKVEVELRSTPERVVTSDAGVVEKAAADVAETTPSPAASPAPTVVPASTSNAAPVAATGGVGTVSRTVISPEMEAKILFGQRKVTPEGKVTNDVVGGHSGEISNAHKNYVVTITKEYPDGTRTGKFLTQFADGTVSNVKTSSLFPESWSSSKSIDAVRQTGDTPYVAIRADGLTLHHSVIDGVRVEVMKQGENVISGYPCGRPCTDPVKFAAQRSEKQ